MSTQQVSVDGRQLAVTNLDKVLYPATGTTKGEVIDYYTRVAPVLLPLLRQRPITRKRYPDGVGDGAEAPNVFFAKNLPTGTPSWVHRERIEHTSGANEYPLADDAATLVWLAQLAALELHVPQWRFAADGTRLAPDRLVFDLDPGEGVRLADCAEVADWVRELLDGLGFASYPVTSGSKGLHLYAPLNGELDSDGATDVAHHLAQALQSRHPDRVTAVMRKADRAGKVFVDWSQNNGSKTTISPYSLRGRQRPWVAAPRTWAELGAADLRQLEFTEVLARLATDGDPLAALSGPDTDRLATYRGMRDATKTPEPVPAAGPGTGSGNSFVIQEHHARRLHYDVRLERDGVLVSWAVPKGPPTDSGTNHLAVHVEDHPLAYGGFEGTIPAGEYGAGTVRIWDAGSYELSKWREGAEVIATLHGRPDGGLGGAPVTFALIHTDANNWLMHKMAPPQAAAVPVRRSRGLPPGRLTPMLAVAAEPDSLGTGEGWAFEMKWDGVRALVTIAAGEASITSRNGRDEGPRYPELADDLLAIGCSSATLDGEIVALDAGGAPDFGLLQARINLTKPGDIAAAARTTPVRLMLFDLLELDGSSLLDLPYEHRRELLEQLVPSGLGRVEVPPAFDGDVHAALEASEAFRLEGVVAKRLGSAYLPGRRSDTWLKIKHRRTQSVVIGGWRPGEGRRGGTIGSVLVGVPDGDALRFLGRVGSGFTDAGLTEAQTVLDALASDESPFRDAPADSARQARWVRPERVAEVGFAAISADGHLRHPVWLGWRPDLDPAEVRFEH